MAIDTLPDEDKSEAVKPDFLKGVGSGTIGSASKKTSDGKKGIGPDGKSLTPGGKDFSSALGDAPLKLAGAANKLAGGINPVSKVTFLAKLGKLVAGTSRRKRTTIGGGIVGFIIGVIFIVISAVSGPFQFIHIAELLLHSGSIADLSDASNERMGRLARFAKTGDYGETRLGFLGSQLKTSMVTELGEKGITPNYNRGTFESLTIDTNNENSPYNGIDNEDDLGKALEGDGLSSDSFTIAKTGEAGVFTVTPSEGGGLLSSYLKGRAFSNFLADNIDGNFIPDFVRTYVFDQYGFINLHPLRQLSNSLDTKINEKVYELWDKATQNYESTGQQPTEINTSGGEQEVTEPNGTVVDEPLAGESGSFLPSSKIIQSNLEGLVKSGPGKAAGGAALGIGIVCSARLVDENIGKFRYIEDVLPLTRLAGNAISVGEQVMNGQDVDPHELSILAQQFTSSQGDWSDAQTFQADENEPLTGQDMNSGVKQALSNQSIPWLAWTESAPVNALCTGVTGAVTTVAAVALGVIGNGGVISSGLQFAAQALVTGKIISEVSHLLAGDAINVATAAGPALGNDWNYGSRYLGNAMATQQGGLPMTNAQVSQVESNEATIEKKQFDSESIADRYFNPYNDQSLISQVMDKISPSATRNVGSIFDGVIGFVKTLALMPFKLVTSMVSADTPTTYTYPFPEVGFSQQDLSNPLVSNPYTNADAVAAILDAASQSGYSGPNYFQYVQTCFNDNIQKVDGRWDVIPISNPSTQAFNIYSDDPGDQYPSYCESNSTDWLRIRFFIFDTSVMEGYACGALQDEQSCQNDGVDSASEIIGQSTSSPTTSSSGSTSSGSGSTSSPGSTQTGSSLNINNTAAKQLAQKLAVNGTKIGYALYDSSGQQLASYDNFENYGASITKSMILVAYLNQVGSGALSNTAKTYLSNMIEISDDASANWVYKQLNNGPKEIKAVATEAGMTGFEFNTSDPLYVLGQSKITANDFARFFSKVDTLINSSQRSYGLSLLSNLSSEDQVGLLKSGLPGTVYSKEGWKGETPNDLGPPYIVNQAAQFSFNGQTYGVAVTVSGIDASGSTGQDDGQNIIQQIVSTLISIGT